MDNLPSQPIFTDVPEYGPISGEVSFNRLEHVNVDTPDKVDSIVEKSFNVSVLSVDVVDEPTDLYEGVVNSGCADGISLSQAELGDDILTYTPPSPPNITYDFNIPNRPDISLDEVDTSSNSVDISILNSMPDLFNNLESVATSVIDDVLVNLSNNRFNIFNNKIKSGVLGFALSSRGISQSTSNSIVALSRIGDSVTRKMLLSDRIINNSFLPKGLFKLNSVKFGNHNNIQNATLDTAKLNTSLSLQDIALAVMVYNSEVANAKLEYDEFFYITKLEVDKLNLYAEEIKAYKNAQSGNVELMKVYKKQLSIVEQLFNTFEQSMALSEMVIKLSSKQIDVEVANIETQTKLIKGQAGQAKNDAYQAQNETLAYGMPEDSSLVKVSADLSAYRANTSIDILQSDEYTKNLNIDADSTYLDVLSESASIKARSIVALFDLSTSKHYNNATLSFLNSHARSEVAVTEDFSAQDRAVELANAKDKTVNDQSMVVDGYRRGQDAKLKGLESFLDNRQKGADLVQAARTEQQLNQIITTG